MISTKQVSLVLLAVIACATAFAADGETSYLPPELAWSGKSRALVVADDDPWITPAEAAGLKSTPRYDETVAWLEKLVAAAPQLSMTSLGKSAEGRDVWMVVASKEGASSPAALRRNGRPTLLAQAGIHSGEIDGKDAGLMLLRDVTVGGRKTELLDGANLLFVPILSVDGHERFSRYSRINQRGPVEMGWRTNRRNLNLNRDYAKLETEELRALVAAVNAWRPDLYLDLHVTDGVDYQYDITYGFNGRHGWSPRIGAWLEETLSPTINRDLEAMGHVPGPLVFGANGRDMSGGNLAWTGPPRFSNGWGDARHLPTVLVENHSLKPYEQRVLGTYVFLESTMRLLARDGAELRRAVKADRGAHAAEIPLDWKVDRSGQLATAPFKGVRSELFLSPVSGTMTVRWTGEPIDQEVSVVPMNQPATTVKRPSRYFIPAAWYTIAELLERQGIEVKRFDSATTVDAEIYRLPEASLDAESSPFEGRTLYKTGELRTERRELRLPAGSFEVSTEQELGTLAVLMLEPACSDSLFRWGYFAEVLQRTEYFESYVVEPMARAMLDEDAGLRAEFEQKLLSDSEFAGNARKRLEWFYERTEFYDAEYRVYPVARSVD